MSLSRRLGRFCVDKDKSYGSIIFEAGEVLKGNIDAAEGRVFRWLRSPVQLEVFQRAESLYNEWCDAARASCVAWVLIAKRLAVNKDVRKLIAKKVWEARREM